MAYDIYANGEYYRKNPTWDIEDSPWKAREILCMLKRNKLAPKAVCEVGCGAGEILKCIQEKMDKNCVFSGYEISKEAYELCKQKANDKLYFKFGDILREKNTRFDLVLLIDVIEHIEDYIGFLKAIKEKGEFKIFHIPLDVSVQSVFRKNRMLKDRKTVGHIHYFTKDMALHALKDAGHEVLDWFYTATSIELKPRSIRRYLARLPRSILFAINKDFAVRIMGGYSIMVLTR